MQIHSETSLVLKTWAAKVGRFREQCNINMTVTEQVCERQCHVRVTRENDKEKSESGWKRGKGETVFLKHEESTPDIDGTSRLRLKGI